MKIRIKAVIVLNAKEADTARHLMHRAVAQGDTPGMLVSASKEEREFLEKYENRVSRVDGALAVADGEATADYAEPARRAKTKTHASA